MQIEPSSSPSSAQNPWLSPESNDAEEKADGPLAAFLAGIRSEPLIIKMLQRFYDFMPTTPDLALLSTGGPIPFYASRTDISVSKGYILVRTIGALITCPLTQHLLRIFVTIHTLDKYMGKTRFFPIQKK